MKELAGIIVATQVAVGSVMAWPAMAQNYEGKWSGQFQVTAGTPPNCTAKGPIAVSVSGQTVNIEVSQQGSTMQMSGGLRSDGSWETFVRLPDGTFTGFTGQFEGRTFSGNYSGGGSGCIGTFAGSKS
jgi:hypothetical protein